MNIIHVRGSTRMCVLSLACLFSEHTNKMHVGSANLQLREVRKVYTQIEERVKCQESGTGSRRKSLRKISRSALHCARADALAPPRAMATTTTAIVWSGGGEASRAGAGPNEGKTFVHFGPSCTLSTFLADLPRHSPNVTRCRVNLITLKEFHTRVNVQNMDETV